MLKIGALSFINALPFFHPLLSNKVTTDASFETGAPTEINALLERGEIDIGLISSASFLANRDKYVLLTNLGIGATRQMGSVSLFTKEELHTLDGKVIAVPNASATSVMLLRILCMHFWNVSPLFVEYTKETQAFKLLERVDGLLMIGDEALSHAVSCSYHVTDLANSWYTHTKKPFVFAVFATRCDKWMRQCEEVRDFHYALSCAYNYSQDNFEETLEKAKEKTGLSLRFLKNYFKMIDYQLHSDHFQGLEYFAQLAHV